MKWTVFVLALVAIGVRSASIETQETVVSNIQTDDVPANIEKLEPVISNVETEDVPANIVKTETVVSNVETQDAPAKIEAVVRVDTEELTAKIAKLDQILHKAEKFQQAFDKTEEFLKNAMHVQEIMERSTNLAAWNPHWEEYEENDYYDRNLPRHYSEPQSVNLFAEIPSHAAQNEFSGENHVQEHSGEVMDHLDAESVNEISEYIDSVIQEKLKLSH